MNASYRHWGLTSDSSRWRFPLTLFASAVLFLVIDKIGTVSDASGLGSIRNGLTIAILIVTSVYLVKASMHTYAAAPQRGLSTTIYRSVLCVSALACVLCACAVGACFSGAYPGLYPRVVAALVYFFAACVVWFLSVGFWLADEYGWLVSLSFFGALAATGACVGNAVMALQILHLVGPLPQVTVSIPKLPLSVTGLQVLLLGFGCLVTYFVVNTTRYLLLTGSLLIALVAGVPATLMLVWSTLGFCFFADSPLSTPVAALFAIVHVLLIGFAAADTAPPGLSHLLHWRASRREKRISRACEVLEAEWHAVAEGQMKWLLQNYSAVRFPQVGDVYEATYDAPVIGEGSDGRILWHQPLVVPTGEQVKIVSTPRYIRAPERTVAWQYLTQRIRAIGLSAGTGWPPGEGITLQAYYVDLRCLMEQFRLVSAGERDSQRWHELSLEGLRDLDECTAVAISRFGGRLNCDTITAMSNEAARALQQHSGGELGGGVAVSEWAHVA